MATLRVLATSKPPEKMKFAILLFAVLLNIAFSFPQNVFIGKDGTVGASFGGYTASAGLGGLAGGQGAKGGLFAQAGTPQGHFASAGLGGSASGNSGAQGHLFSSAGQHRVVGGPSQGAPQPGGQNNVNRGPLDDIFNIPIQTLGAVNQYLNNRRKGAQGFSGGPGPAGGPSYVRSNYDDIFNIPISVLNSVNGFLNGN